MKNNNTDKYLVNYTDMDGNRLYREDEVNLIRNDYNHLLISKDNEINYLKESLNFSNNEINNLRILLNTRFSTDINNGNILNNNLQLEKLYNERNKDLMKEIDRKVVEESKKKDKHYDNVIKKMIIDIKHLLNCIDKDNPLYDLMKEKYEIGDDK